MHNAGPQTSSVKVCVMKHQQQFSEVELVRNYLAT